MYVHTLAHDSASGRPAGLNPRIRYDSPGRGLRGRSFGVEDAVKEAERDDAGDEAELHPFTQLERI